MILIEILIYVGALMLAGTLSIPFSAMIARKRPILVFLLPVLLAVLSLIFFIIFWSSTMEGKQFYYTLGLYSLFAFLGSVLGSIYIIFIRRRYKI